MSTKRAKANKILMDAICSQTRLTERLGTMAFHEFLICTNDRVDEFIRDTADLFSKIDEPTVAWELTKLLDPQPPSKAL